MQHEQAAGEPAELMDDASLQDLVAPYMDLLLRAARHDLAYYVAQGVLHEADLTPEEVVGQGLIQAWEHHEHRPQGMTLKAWLLSVQLHALRGLVDQIRSYRREKALSLDDALPLEVEPTVTKDWFEGWTNAERRLAWEDVIPAAEPFDVEISLLADRAGLFEADAWHVLLLHDEYDLSLPETTYALGRAVNEVAKMLGQARATYRERIPSHERVKG